MSQPHLDPALVRACLTGSMNAYYAFSNPGNHPHTVPMGFASKPEVFRGWDDFLDTPSGETFALAYRGLQDPGTVLVAFRGTASFWDAVIDAFEYGQEFHPYSARQPLPPDLYVAQGFQDVYVGTDSGLPVSLQTSLFRYLEKIEAHRVIVTGHSLGGALANLFALDVALSRPSASVQNVTFAAPRTGKDSWQRFYNTLTSGGMPLGDSTFRIENVHDFVPCLPLFNPASYQHVGHDFKLEFMPSKYGDSFTASVLARHSLANYLFVMNKALSVPQGQPQEWAGLFPDYSKENPDQYAKMESQPPTSADCSLLWELAQEAGYGPGQRSTTRGANAGR